MIRRMICYLLALSMLAWIGGFVYFMNLISKSCTLDKKINAEAIIVLTGGKSRIEIGLELLKENPTKRLFITGVNSKIQKIIDVIKIFTSLSLELENRVEFGRLATSTFENALETKKWVESNHINSITLVTSNYHMPRSLLVFKDKVPNVSIESYTVCSRVITLNNLLQEPKTILFFLKEYAKYSVVVIHCYTKKYITR